MNTNHLHMDAAEIIETKTWEDLTEAERTFIQPLAEDRESFELMKQMMQVSSLEASDTPKVSPKVKERLHEAVMSIPSRRKSYIGWAVAASLLAALAVWWMLGNRDTISNTKNNDAVVKLPADEPASKPAVIKPDTQTVQSRLPNTADVIAPKEPNRENQISFVKKDVNRSNSKSPAPTYNKVNISIGDDPELLAIVTETF